MHFTANFLLKSKINVLYQHSPYHCTVPIEPSLRMKWKREKMCSEMIPIDLVNKNVYTIYMLE